MNARLDESQVGIKIAQRNVNNLGYADDTTLMAWRGAKVPLDEGERGGGKSWLEIQHEKTKITASSPITSWQTDEKKMEAVTDFIFWWGGLQNHCGWWLQPWN